MNRTLRILAATLILTGIANAEVALGVMTFNVRYGTANDGPNHWNKRKDIAVEVIESLAPDIIGTQECLDFQARYFVEKLPDYAWFGVGREPDLGGEHMAVLYKTKVLAPIESGNFWLSETPETIGSISWNSACRRMVTWAKFYHIASGQSFYYFNTHLDHKSEPARQGGAKLIAERIGKISADLPVILTGDFNSVAGASEAYTILTGSGLIDTWIATQNRVGPSITWSGFAAPEPNKDQRIDWILTRGPVTVQKCETVTYNKKGRYPTDHFPVFASITIGK